MLRWTNRITWLVLIIDLIVIAIAHKLRFRDVRQVLHLAYWLIGSLAAAATYSIMYYRVFFRRWIGWFTALSVMLFSDLVVQDIIPIKTPPLPFFFLMLFLTSFWAVGPASAVLLWQRDVGLKFFAIGSIVIVWTVTLAWQHQGNIFQLILQVIQQPKILWWMPPWLCLCIWIAPMGILGFLGHTIRLIIVEIFNVHRFQR